MPSYKTRCTLCCENKLLYSFIIITILWCANSVSHSRAGHLIYLSHVTADKDSTLIIGQTAETQVYLSSEHRLLMRRRSCCWTEKAFLSATADNKASLEPQWARSEVPFFSARWDKWRVQLSVSLGAVCHQPLSASGILLHEREACKKTSRMFSVECNSPAHPDLWLFPLSH